ncbi:hypothetical protein L484_019265 [Morus notabilis]|uniref:Protein XRI1 n=1 Tax=Morus notabilis TaxID=981085 RepID=W9SG66_9ROSA|nr:protein XRI1 isoform X2 [Morus notabilis]EXC05018.1 hypothetical protein L484_019265 [Morus notabilis]
MGELHLPMPSYTIDNNSLHNSSLGWDHNFHSLGVLNKDIMSLVMEGNYSTPFLSPLGSEQEDDFSTGYLEDALVEFSERSKRRRLLLFSDEEIMNMRDSNFLPRGLWNTSNWELSEDFSFTSHMTTFNELSGGPISTSVCSVLGEEANMVMTEMKTPEEEKSFSEIIDSSPSSSSCKDSADTKSIISDKQALFSLDLPGSEKSRKKRPAVITRVVYPFAVVKPGGREGDVTLNDINERILMPPTRPVRHPVGDFACRPCVSPHGPGLSGKAVVALTRIHTQGRGTITIIRTKG